MDASSDARTRFPDVTPARARQNGRARNDAASPLGVFHSRHCVRCDIRPSHVRDRLYKRTSNTSRQRVRHDERILGMDARRRGQARKLWVTRREPRAHVFLRRALARIITHPRRRVLPTVTARRRVWRRSRDLRARAPSCATHLYGDVRSRRARFRAPRACAS